MSGRVETGATRRAGGTERDARAAGHRAAVLLAFGALGALSAAALLGGCSSGGAGGSPQTAESCMTCHNGSTHNDYAGPGIENPHPFGAFADSPMRCTVCHGGNPNGVDKDSSHVPPPPEIGDREFQETNRLAWFNKLTLTGIDKLPNYSVDGRNYTALQYLRFIQPGDLRVVSQGQSCGQCHNSHAQYVSESLLATSAGLFSGATFAIGEDSRVPENAGLYEDTAADVAFRAETDAGFNPGNADTGAVGEVVEFPVFSRRNGTAPDDIHDNDDYDSGGLAAGIDPVDGSVIPGSPLANLFHEQVAFTCGDCHLGSAGANNRAGDFRSSGCTACHMPYSLGGRSGSGDPNIDPFEPLDPDDIDDGERPHVRRHIIRSVAQTLPSGEFLPGIDDYSCAGCHQGSNRTVMQYWGIRLDQNQDVRRGVQYPANPADWEGTTGDTRLFDPVVGNDTFNGRNRNQYLAFEDYDGDGRDDTPADVHYEAGMGCIDCHGSYDLHGGDVGSNSPGNMMSRMEQSVAIRCEDCHGGVDSYAPTVAGTTHDGSAGQVAVDSKGNPLPHVVLEGDGNYYLYSKLTGERHFVVQTRDTVVDAGKTHPFTSAPIYSAKASYAMGRADGDPATGLGPVQTGGTTHGFSHADNLSCAACHSSWTNNCIGCHLVGEFNGGNNYSNITGERIVFRERDALFTYQSPVFFQLGVGANNKIEPIAANTDAFFQYRDQDGNFSQVFSFSDRKGKGMNAAAPAHPAMNHNVMMPHSIRGRVDADDEGPRYCAACHLTDEGLATYGTEYDVLRTAMSSGDMSGLTPAFFDTLTDHIGRNTGNAMNSPLWVHMASGLGSGLFLFDEHGAPVNPLDDEANRAGAGGVAPSAAFDLGRVKLNLDRIVDETGLSLSSNNHPLMNPGVGPNLRDGATDPNMSGPLGGTLLQALTDPTNGIVLDSWFDADGQPQGDAGTHTGSNP